VVSSLLDRLAPAALAAGALFPGVLSLAFGGVIAIRRLTGAAPLSPGPTAVMLSCAVGTVLAWLADLASRSGRAGRPASGPAVLARIGLIVSLAAVALPARLSSSADCVALVVATSCAAATLLRRPAIRPPDRSRGSLAAPVAVHPLGIAPPAAPLLAASSAGFPPGAATGPMADDEGPIGSGSLVQRFERRILPDGSECVRGRLHVVVPAGARLGAGHVGFCPPLSAAPTVQVSTDYDAVEAIVTAAEVLPWGARIECRLDEPAEEAIRVPVDLSARAAS